ncbi:HNH endonuclease signature motif containing protein [Candidatus Poriferisodalis sp.]|uniref:HNH endonuclease signature motif containing protein n=1 Tax=Candidatus Poriferisodalis sp. TaxID=3101277 RepID=UPI003B01FAE4
MFIDSPGHRICDDAAAAHAVGSPGDDAQGASRADTARNGVADVDPAGVERSRPTFGDIDTARCGVAGVDLAVLNNSALEDRVVSLVAERARVEGEYLAALGELTSRCGSQSAAWQLREFTRMNSAQARTESRLAESLVEHDLSATLDALTAGEIQASHAKVIAREAPKKHRRSEAEFLELCRTYPSDTVARNPLAYESLAVYADLEAEAAAAGLGPIDAELALQRFERSGSMRMGDDGMWQLHAKLDFITGRQVSAAIQAAVRSQRHRNNDNKFNNTNTNTNTNNGSGSGDGDNNGNGSGTGNGSDVGGDEPTRAQLTADAISDLIAGTAKTRRAATNMLIIADYDIANDRLANPRLDDGTPLSAQMLADYAVDANVLPAVFSSDWSQLALGRTRNANDAQRLILAVRDGGCIGCDLTSEHTQAHHIQYFENNGLTDIPNLASLCEPCHKDLHQHDRKIDTPPNGRPRPLPPEHHNAAAPALAVATARSP